MSYREEAGPLRERIAGLERELAALTEERDRLARSREREHRRGTLFAALLGAYQGELPGTAWPEVRRRWLFCVVLAGAFWVTGLVTLGLGLRELAWPLVNLAVLAGVGAPALVWAAAQRVLLGALVALAKLGLAVQAGAGWWALRGDVLVRHPEAPLWCWWLPGAVLALTIAEGLALRVVVRR